MIRANFVDVHYCKRLIVLGLLAVFTFQTARSQDTVIKEPAKQIQLGGLKNLYKVSNDVYRSEQPNRKEMKKLEEFGVYTVINFRNNSNDNRFGKKTNLILIDLPINTWNISNADILNALNEIQKAKKPVLLHCLHGSDRTGAVIAAYRMVINNWSREDAIKEFLEPKYGYHEKWFPNILELLDTLDIDTMKRELEEIQ